LEVEFMLLAVDTSTRWIGIALYAENQVLGEMLWQTNTHHSVELAPSIASLLKHCEVVPAQIKALGVALGPGSFTSLRIGLAVVKGLALGLHIPVIGVPSFDILAAAQPLMENVTLLPILQAGRTRLAVGRYTVKDSAWVNSGEIKVMTAEEVSAKIKGPTLVCGEVDDTLRQALGRKRKNVMIASPAQSLRRPAYLAEIAWQRWQKDEVDEVISLAPIYLHVGDALPA
jgi:tRNA threonylcarbamoyladenosine biosynthesis protein TsaB